MKPLRSAAAYLFVLVLVAGCASTDVTNRKTYAGAPLPRPDRILVYDFTANPDNIPPESSFSGQNAGKPTPEQLQITERVGADVAKQVVADLREAGLPAVQAAGQPAAKVNDIVIKGYFGSVDQGSAVKRVLIGFGSGDASLVTVVEGYQMKSYGLHLLGSGEVNSEGGQMPGVILPLAVLAATANPIGLVVGGTLKLAGEASGTTTIEGAAKRTADEVSTQLVDAAKKQGWIQ